MVDWLGEPSQRQFGMGYGALVAGTAFLFLLTRGQSLLGMVAGDAFVAASLGLVMALTLLFIGLANAFLLCFIAGSIAGMQEFKRDLHRPAFDAAVALLLSAPSV